MNVCKKRLSTNQKHFLIFEFVSWTIAVVVLLVRMTDGGAGGGNRFNIRNIHSSHSSPSPSSWNAQETSILLIFAGLSICLWSLMGSGPYSGTVSLLMGYMCLGLIRLFALLFIFVYHTNTIVRSTAIGFATIFISTYVVSTLAIWAINTVKVRRLALQNQTEGDGHGLDGNVTDEYDQDQYLNAASSLPYCGRGGYYQTVAVTDTAHAATAFCHHTNNDNESFRRLTPTTTYNETSSRGFISIVRPRPPPPTYDHSAAVDGDLPTYEDAIKGEPPPYDSCIISNNG